MPGIYHKQMNITFITTTSYIDTAFPLINILAKHNKINLFVNFSDNNKRSSFISIDESFYKNKIIVNNYDLLGDSKKIIDDWTNISLTFIYWKKWKISCFKNWLFLIKLNRLLNRNSVFHIQVMSFFWLFLLKLRRIKNIIIDYHDPIEHSDSQASKMLYLVKKQFNALSKNIIIHNKSVIPEFEKLYYVDSSKIVYTPFGKIPLHKIYRTAPTKNIKNSLLFFGRFSPYKGIEYLIEAAKMARKNITDLKVIIAGSGKIYFDTTDIKADNTFQIINRYIPNNELAQLIQESSIVVCPYTDATQSGVVMTAYAFNKPVIATKVGGLPEVVINNYTGKLVPPKDPDALAAAINELLQNPDILVEMTKNIKMFCEQSEFSWKNIAQKTIEVYKK